MFGSDIRAIVPQLAMSAGTMIACSCSTIIMAKHSSLGPTDPHLNGIPAAGVVDEFTRAADEVRADATRVPLWHAIISQYPPTFLSQCENAIMWGKGICWGSASECDVCRGARRGGQGGRGGAAPHGLQRQQEPL